MRVALRQVGVRFGDIQALSDVSLSFEAGVTYAVVGPGGAGKSTLLRVLAGLQTPTSGELLWEGEPVDAGINIGRLLRYRDHLGYLPQHTGLYDDLTLEQLLGYFAALKGIPPELVAERSRQLLTVTGLLPFQKRRVAHLSTGERRLLTLAIALLNDPPLLLLDEPLRGLDIETRRRVLALLTGGAFFAAAATGTVWGAPGRVLVFTSHILEDVEEVADHLVVLRSGKVLWQGPCRALRAHAPTLTEAYLQIVRG